MRLALLLPLALALGAWLTQWAFAFDQGSTGASGTAAALVLGLVAGVIPVPIAVAKLVRHPSARTPASIGLTILSAAVLAVGLLVVLALASRR
jgi:hypothetical protein